MMPPENPQGHVNAGSAEVSSAASLRPDGIKTLTTLTQRADFQRASRAGHVAKPGFVLQMRRRRPGEQVDSETIRIGYTCSKKVGNAVARNRAKRRLREIARLALPMLGHAGCDYVLVGRKGKTADLAFAKLQSDFEHALLILHQKPK